MPLASARQHLEVEPDPPPRAPRRRRVRPGGGASPGAPTVRFPAEVASVVSEHVLGHQFHDMATTVKNSQARSNGLGSPTRRKRVVVVAAHHNSLKIGELELPLPGDERMPTDGIKMPTATNNKLPGAGRHNPRGLQGADRREYEQLGVDHYQYALPAVQVGRLPTSTVGT